MILLETFTKSKIHFVSKVFAGCAADTVVVQYSHCAVDSLHSTFTVKYGHCATQLLYAGHGEQLDEG